MESFPAKPMPSEETRRSGPWRASAARVDAGPNAIYFYGAASEALDSQPGQWRGHIAGDIYVEGPTQRIMIPDGQLKVGPNNAMSISGAHKVTTISP
jgi:hypothetical protein